MVPVEGRSEKEGRGQLVRICDKKSSLLEANHARLPGLQLKKGSTYRGRECQREVKRDDARPKEKGGEGHHAHDSALTVKTEGNRSKTQRGEEGKEVIRGRKSIRKAEFGGRRTPPGIRRRTKGKLKQQ